MLEAKEASITSLQALLAGQRRAAEEAAELYEDQRVALKASVTQMGSRAIGYAETRPSEDLLRATADLRAQLATLQHAYGSGQQAHALLLQDNEVTRGDNQRLQASHGSLLEQNRKLVEMAGGSLTLAREAGREAGAGREARRAAAAAAAAADEAEAGPGGSVAAGAVDEVVRELLAVRQQRDTMQEQLQLLGSAFQELQGSSSRRQERLEGRVARRREELAGVRRLLSEARGEVAIGVHRHTAEAGSAAAQVGSTGDAPRQSCTAGVILRLLIVRFGGLRRAGVSSQRLI
ncbi:MAG: hypothetical protein WDW36_002316 [Sanguina aurantia]